MAKLPSVVSSIPQDLKAFVNQVREALDGRNGDKLVTVNDLVRGGIAAPGPGGSVVPPAGIVGAPATPTNVQASGAIQNIVVTWDAPMYNGHAYAEVWGASIDNLGEAEQVGMTPGAIFVDSVGPSVVRYYWVRFVNTLGVKGAFNAVAGTKGETGADVEYLLETLTNAALDPDSDYSKFAVRADFFYVMPSPDFNQEDTPTATAEGDLWYQPSTELVRTWTGSAWGPFSQTLPFIVNSSPQTVNGVEVPAGVYMDAAFIKNGTITNAKIGNAAIDDAKIANLSASKITAGSISVGSFIQSSNYAIGSQGWKIFGDGTAEFGAASIRGKIAASQVDSRGLTIFDDEGNVVLSTNISQTFAAVAANSNRFVVVGGAGAACYSTDGSTWPPQNTGVTSNLNAIAWDSAGSAFIAAGNGGVLLRTADAVVWTPVVSGSLQNLRGVASNSSIAVVVGAGGTILTSTDRTTWVAATSGVSQSLNAVVWTGSLFVAVGDSGVVLTSSDGTVWAGRDSKTVQQLLGISNSGSFVVAVGTNGAVTTSPDGVTWTVRSSGVSQNLNAVTRSSSLFMAVGNGGQAIRSADGVSWTSTASGTTQTLNGVFWGLGAFVLVGAVGTIRVSVDGTSISPSGGSIFAGNVTGTVAGTAAGTVVSNASTALSTANTANSTANTALSGLSTKLNSDARNVLAGAGGLATGTLSWNSSGVRTGGFGVGFTQAGIVAYNSSGAATFVLNGTTGSATFAGDITAGTVGGNTVGTTFVRSANYVTGVSGWEIDSNGDAEFNQLTVRSGQVTGALLKAVRVNFNSGLYVQTSGGVPISTTNGPYYIYGAGSPYYLIGTITMPTPETAAHNIAAVINVQAQTGGTSKDLSIALVADANYYGPGGTYVSGEILAANTDSGTFAISTNSSGVTATSFTSATNVGIFVTGNNADYTIGNVFGFLFGVR